MTNNEIVLNIAVNLGRIGKFVSQGRTDRARQFLEETKKYVSAINVSTLSDTYRKTHTRFLQSFSILQNTEPVGDIWAEEAFTWANILTHRAKLA